MTFTQTCSACGIRPSGRRGVCVPCRMQRNAQLGLGDIVAAGLSAVGITKERVSKALGRPCGCGQRQEALNKLGRRLGIG